jgi:hypothetical protein
MTSRAKLSRSLRSSQKQRRRAGLPSTARRVRQAALAQVKDDLSRFLRLAASEEIVITRHGKPAGASLRSGHGVRLEDSDPNGRSNLRLERSGATLAAQPGRSAADHQESTWAF